MAINMHKLLAFAGDQDSIISDTGVASPAAPDQLAEPEHQPDNEPAVRYGVQVAGYHFLVPRDTSTELLREPASQPLPMAPEWIHGLCNYHGEIVPLINLDILVGSTRNTPEIDYALVVDDGDGALAIRIDALPVAIQLGSDAEHRIETPETFASYVTSTYQFEGEIWFEIDISRLVAEQIDS